MASNITLSSSVRQNLLSLQSTAQMMSMTQNRLATGKKVNSALDNPSNFFTSQSLNNRASDLGTLMDSIGQAQQTLKQADTGISSLTKLVESAKSLAKQAQQSSAPAASYTQTITSSAIAADTPATATSTATSASVYGAASDGDTLSITVGGTTHDFTFASTGASAAAGTFSDTSELQAAITAAGLTGITVSDDSSGNLKIDAASGSFTVGGDMGTDFGFATTANAPSNSTLSAMAGQSLSITVGSGSTATLNITATTTRADVSSWLGAQNFGTGVSASLNSSNQIEITQSGAQASNIVIGGTAAAGLDLDNGTGATTGTYVPTGSVATSAYSSTRTTYENQYNDLLKQIDTLASDSSYNGVNLLNGDDLKVTFNEDGSSSLTIKGVKFDSASLGMTALNAGDFQSNSSIDAVVAKVDAALSSLRTQAAKFGSNLTTVQTRQDFTKNMINNLQVGADALVLADTNEEGANLLALQTRQQLSTTALSLSAQADQAVLRLF